MSCAIAARMPRTFVAATRRRHRTADEDAALDVAGDDRPDDRERDVRVVVVRAGTEIDRTWSSASQGVEDRLLSARPPWSKPQANLIARAGPALAPRRSCRQATPRRTRRNALSGKLTPRARRRGRARSAGTASPPAPAPTRAPARPAPAARRPSRASARCRRPRASART